MLQMHRHQLRAVIGTSNVKVSKRKFTFNRSLIEFRLINIIVINIFSNLLNIIAWICCNVAIVSTKTCMSFVALLIIGWVSKNFTIISITDVEDFVLIHTVDTVNIFLAFLLLIRDIRVIAITNKVDEILLVSSLSILNILKRIKSSCFISH